MQRKKLDGRGIAPHSEPLTKIHALRKERDYDGADAQDHLHDFNPRAPQGARRAVLNGEDKEKVFQSTRSARSATSSPRWSSLSAKFQSTRSARSATSSVPTIEAIYQFQSTRSARSATAKVDIKGLFCDASITIIRHICVFS